MACSIVFLDKNDRYWIETYSTGVNYSRSFVRNFKLHPLTTEYSEVKKSIRLFYFANDGTQLFLYLKRICDDKKSGYVSFLGKFSEYEWADSPAILISTKETLIHSKPINQEIFGLPPFPEFTDICQTKSKL